MIESIEIIEWVNQKKARPSLSPENFLQNQPALCRKDRMWDNFQRMAQQMGSGQFDFVPETFVLPQQLRSFKHRYLKTRRKSETLQLAGMMGFGGVNRKFGKKNQIYLQHSWVEI